MADGVAVVGGEGVAGGGQGEQGQEAAGGRTGWQMLRSILFQILIFYVVTSFFRGRQQSQQPATTPGGAHPFAGTNLFPKGQELVSEHYLEYLTFLGASCVDNWF